MKLEDILKRLLPTTMSPKSVEGIASNLEQIGKLSAGLLAIFYVVGLIIFGLYYSSLNVRSFELFKVRYIFVGFYYLAFLLLHLVYPHWWIKRFWAKVLYFLILAALIIGLLNFDRIRSLYFLIIYPIILPLPLDGNDAEFEILAILKYFGAFLMLFFLSTIIFSYSLGMAENLGRKVSGRFFVFFIFFAIALNYFIFATFFFPNIPAAIGGGQAPFVSIVFDTGVSNEITKYFNVTSTESYFGRLVFMDNNSVFLQGYSLQKPDVHEIRRSDIIMISYGPSNEGMMEIIKMQQEILDP